MSGPELKPCPFCRGVAEQDYQQPYRRISDGQHGKACAIYCTICSANMILCHEDHSGTSPDDLMAELVTDWNRRDPTALAARDRAKDDRIAEREAALAGVLSVVRAEFAKWIGQMDPKAGERSRVEWNLATGLRDRVIEAMTRILASIQLVDHDAVAQSGAERLVLNDRYQAIVDQAIRQADKDERSGLNQRIGPS